MIQFDEHVVPMGWNHHLAHRFFLYQQVRQISESGNHFNYGCFSFKLSSLGNKMKHNLGCPPFPIIAIVEGINDKTSDDAYCRHEHWHGKETPSKTQRCHLGKKTWSSWLSFELSGRVAKENIPVSLGRWPWKKHQVDFWLNYSLLETNVACTWK